MSPEEHVTFNLPEFLVAMREEQRADLKTVAEKVDTVLGKVNNHESRLQLVENTRETARWLIGVLVVALLGAGFDYMFNHRGSASPTQQVNGGIK